MIKKIILFLLILIFSLNTVYAQQTIISVPSSDVLPKGDIILKESNRINPFDDTQSYQITPTVIFGSGWGTETSIGTASTLKKDSQTGIRLDIASKKVFYLGKTSRLTIGGRISPYLNTGQNPDSFLFMHGTQRIKKTKTSITSGIYTGGRSQMPGNFGALVGLDQVIIPNKLRLAVDYTTRTDSFGAFNAGFKFRPKPDLSITTAVSLPCDPEKKIGFIVSFSKYIGNIEDVYAKIKSVKDKGDL